MCQQLERNKEENMKVWSSEVRSANYLPATTCGDSRLHLTATGLKRYNYNDTTRTEPQGCNDTTDIK